MEPSLIDRIRSESSSPRATNGRIWITINPATFTIYLSKGARDLLGLHNYNLDVAFYRHQDGILFEPVEETTPRSCIYVVNSATSCITCRPVVGDIIEKCDWRTTKGIKRVPAAQLDQQEKALAFLFGDIQEAADKQRRDSE